MKKKKMRKEKRWDSNTAIGEQAKTSLLQLYSFAAGITSDEQLSTRNNWQAAYIPPSGVKL